MSNLDACPHPSPLLDCCSPQLLAVNLDIDPYQSIDQNEENFKIICQGSLLAPNIVTISHNIKNHCEIIEDQTYMIIEVTQPKY